MILGILVLEYDVYVQNVMTSVVFVSKRSRNNFTANSHVWIESFDSSVCHHKTDM